MPKAKAVPVSLVLALQAITDVDEIEDVAGFLEEIVLTDDDDQFDTDDMPTAMPRAIRDRILTLVKGRRALADELHRYVKPLAGIASKLSEKAEAADEASRPHCPTCDHIIDRKLAETITKRIVGFPDKKANVRDERRAPRHP